MLIKFAIRCRSSKYFWINCNRGQWIKSLTNVTNNNRYVGRCLFATKSSSSNKRNVDKKLPSNKVYTIPNMLCMARIAITPVIGYMIVKENFDYALATCAISSMTDFLDGWIARNFNSISKLGSVLDPLADKFLVASLTLTLTYVNLIPVWLTTLIFTRDFLIITGGLWMRYRALTPPITFNRFFDITTFASERYSPTFASKINTGFQLSLVSLTLASPVFISLSQQWDLLLPILQWSTGITTLWSGLLYIKRLK